MEWLLVYAASTFIFIVLIILLATYGHHGNIYLKKYTPHVVVDHRNMVSVTPVNLPYTVDIREQTAGALRLSIKGTKKCVLTLYVCVSAKDLQRVVVEKKYSGTDCQRTLADVLDLISVWVSEPVDVCFSDEGLYEHTFTFSLLPADVRRQLVDVDVERFVPLVAHLQLSNEENEILNGENEIQSIATNITMEKSVNIPSAPPLDTGDISTAYNDNLLSIESKFQLSDQYIRTVNQRTFLLKRLYKSGVDSMDCGTVSSGDPVTMENNDTTANNEETGEELCLICHEHSVSRALLPCRHCCCCKMCFSQLTLCPICRVAISSYFIVRSEEDVPDAPVVHDNDDVASLIQNEGIWSFIKSIWNAS